MKMQELLRTFARSLGQTLHPRMLWLTVWPFLAAALLWGAAFWFGWESWVAAVQGMLGASSMARGALDWLGAIGVGGLHLVVAPFIVAVISVPLIAMTALLLSAVLATPVVVRHLSTRHYPTLERLHGGSWWGSAWNALCVSGVFLALALLSLPLWLVPPLYAFVPPLLWGWLTYRVMAYDALAEHASVDERRVLLARHRTPLLSMGVVTGLIGSLPTLVWASSAMIIVLFPFVALVTVWLYVLIFVFSALWFGHYCLRALAHLRDEAGGRVGTT
jgi:hypothetical protein